MRKRLETKETLDIVSYGNKHFSSFNEIINAHSGIYVYVANDVEIPEEFTGPCKLIFDRQYTSYKAKCGCNKYGIRNSNGKSYFYLHWTEILKQLRDVRKINL